MLCAKTVVFGIVNDGLSKTLVRALPCGTVLVDEPSPVEVLVSNLPDQYSIFLGFIVQPFRFWVWIFILLDNSFQSSKVKGFF